MSADGAARKKRPHMVGVSVPGKDSLQYSRQRGVRETRPMLSAVAVAAAELPLTLLEMAEVRDRAPDPAGRPVVRFYWRAVPRVLPAWHEGRLKLVAWGNRGGESRSLPVTGWGSQET